MFIKRATLVNVQPVVVDPHKRTAQSLSVFDFEPDKEGGYLYVTARALTSNVPNLNGDMFPDAEMKTAYKSFIGCPVYVEHMNTDLDRARGVIIDAKYHDEDKEDIWTEILMEMDEETFPELCAMIRSGELDTMSMGCSIQGSTCSECDNYAEDYNQFCEHIKNKGANNAYEICNGIEFIEESWVYNPADPTAYMQAIDKTASNNKFSKTADIKNAGLFQNTYNGGVDAFNYVLNENGYNDAMYYSANDFKDDVDGELTPEFIKGFNDAQYENDPYDDGFFYMGKKKESSSCYADEFCKRILELEYNQYKGWPTIYDVFDDGDVIAISESMNLDDDTFHEGVRRFWEETPLWELSLEERQNKLASNRFAIDDDAIFNNDTEKEMFDELVEQLKSTSYETLGDELNDICNDPKLYSLFCEGFGDGDYANVTMDYSEQGIPVQALLPSQNEIGLGNSLAYALKDDCSTYFNNPVTVVSPIITYMGNFIVDGHHRWSQVYMVNPNASIAAINFNYSDASPWRALRNFQGAIAAANGEVPSSSADVANVYDMDESSIRNYIEENIQDVCVDGLCKMVDELETRDDVIDYLTNNALKLASDNHPFPGAPDRDYMPQTDESAIEIIEEGATDI